METSNGYTRPHISNTNRVRHWNPKMKSVKFADRRAKRNKTRERQLREALKNA